MLLKEGSVGKDVGLLHQELLEAGIAVDAAEMKATKYGPSTVAAVSSFQATHGLSPDGICGPKTWTMLTAGEAAADAPPGWMIGPCPAAVRPVVDNAMAMVGTVEVPPASNRGPVIDALNQAAGIPLGSPWCAAFATGMYHYCESNPFPKSLGSVYKVQEWGKKNGCIVSNKDTAMPGDLIIIMRAEGHGHTGIVVGDLGDKVATIEGNAGNAVKKLIRKKADLTCFVRPLGLGLKV